ncbi:MAG TPA: 16S rRNA (cytosine(1402)-N(4))-methyltransferase RsmH [Nitrospirota bacterium]|nr:16S rRNA (cytosine(1402)-N(4))-methyltransferase RsmH [Nitrospirota bacterium]
METLEHKPVLLREAMELLAPRAGGVYLDGTCGAGGHAAAILERTAPDGRVICLDRDTEAVERSRARLAGFAERATVRQADFRDMETVLEDLRIDAVDGVLLDLGVSSFHLKTPERGFSFLLDGPLDMRMDRRGGTTAADLVNDLPRRELARIIREYGEDLRAGAIARAIEKARARGPITSTLQLADITSSVFPSHAPRRIHPATRTFQALRIVVNDEMGSLSAGLRKAYAALRPGGRMAVISFHSLEDRIVKQQFALWAKGCTCPPRMPVCVCGLKPGVKVLTRKPVVPSDEEAGRNPAARSAKLRAAEKLASMQNAN